MARRRRRKKSGWKKRPAKQTHRSPPLPDCFALRKWGTCRWCGRHIYKVDGTINDKRLWHPICVHEYKIVTRPNYAKRQVKKRDKGVCAKCRKKCLYRNEWDCDHIVELADAPRELKYWTLENLQTLCTACHDVKTAAGNAARRARKKEAMSATKAKKVPVQKQDGSVVWCSVHPRYMAKLKPRCDCQVCEYLFKHKAILEQHGIVIGHQFRS